MKKNLYVYIVCFVLLLFVVIALTLKTEALIPSQFTNLFSKQEQIQNAGDSLNVIRLNKAAYDIRLTDTEATLKLADSALNQAEKINYVPGIAEAHRVKGIGYSYLNNTTLSVKNYIEALKHFKKLSDTRNEAKIYNNIGNLYQTNDYDKALSYYRKALSISKNINNDELKAGLYFNIANTYLKKKNYTKSLIYFEKSLPIFTIRKDTTYMIMYLQNTGVAYYNLNDLDEAESRLIEAVNRARKQSLYRIIAESYLTLSNIYLKRNNYTAAEKIIKEGLYYSKFLKDMKLEYDFIHTAYELESKRKNHKKALTYLKLVYKHDSLLLSKNQSENIGITSQHYLQQQKLQENQLTIAQQKYRETLFWWIITIIISVLLLAVVLGFIRYFYLQKKRKKNELLIQNKVASLEQKALQAMMNPHFVFNIMTSIQYFINKEETKAANQILTGFAKLMRKHLEICMNSSISLHEEIIYLRLYLSLEKIRFFDKMDYEITVGPEIQTDEITIPSMLIQPFVENAIWHGIMPKDEGGLIQLEFSKQNSDLLISITDNGVGISNSQKTKTSGHISRGLELIRERVILLNKLNKNQICIKQQQTGEFGTEVLISIPA